MVNTSRKLEEIQAQYEKLEKKTEALRTLYVEALEKIAEISKMV